VAPAALIAEIFMIADISGLCDQGTRPDAPELCTLARAAEALDSRLKIPSDSGANA